MATLRAATLLLAALALAPTAAAEIRIEITGGAEAALPVAMVPFEGSESPQVPVDVAAIVQADLQRSGMFDPVDRSDFLSRPGRFEDVRFQNWRALGVDNLVVGSIAPGPRGFDVRFELLDVYRGSRLVGKRYQVGAGALRTLAHTVANEVFQAIIGRPGGFNTRIAYVGVEGAGDDRRYRLVVADADGFSPQTVLTSAAPLLSPAWSPDGRRLAYVSFESRRSEVYVQEVASGKRRKVASFQGINGAPAWSPDGRRLALALSKDGNPEIYLLEVESGALRRLTNHWAIDTEPVWTPDGKALLFTSDRGGAPQIYRLPVSVAGEPQRVTFEGGYNASPDLSPDGRLLTMVHRTEGRYTIAVMDLESGLVRSLTDGPLDESPTFSPNGAMILYSSSAGSQALATVSVHGRARQPLQSVGDEVREPAWSPGR